MDRAAAFGPLLAAKGAALAALERADADALAEGEALEGRAEGFLAHRQELLGRLQEIDAALAGFGAWWDAGAPGLGAAERRAAEARIADNRAVLSRVLASGGTLAERAGLALKTARRELSDLRKGKKAVSGYRPFGSGAPRYVSKGG